jgi:hypothetical protein
MGAARLSFSTMAKPVFITCPKTKRPVPTGHWMSEQVFQKESSFAILRPVQCRECGELHTWTKEDASLGSPQEVRE